MATVLPLVSCIMPTYNRRQFIPQAIRCFLAQDYSNRELVIVDDGSDRVADLLPRDSRIVYVPQSERMLIGAKRNLACEVSRGKFIAHWDDDDWYAPNRISRQVEALQKTGADLCGSGAFLYRDVWTGGGVYLCCARRRSTADGPVFAGSTFIYRRVAWLNNQFTDPAEDTRFSRGLSKHRIIDIHDASLFVFTRHARNTCHPVPFFTEPGESSTMRLIRFQNAVLNWLRLDRSILDQVLAGARVEHCDHHRPVPARYFTLRGCSTCRFLEWLDEPTDDGHLPQTFWSIRRHEIEAA